MKKSLTIILSLILSSCVFVGCNNETENNAEKNVVEDINIAENNALQNNSEAEKFGENKAYENNVKTVNPLPETLDITALDNCTVAVSLKKGDAYVDDTGKMVMNLTVYSYELYDMVDIAQLTENDVIVRKNEKVTVNKLERLDSGLVRINGGEENGGFDLFSDNSTVYYEVGMNDAKAYYELGNVTLPVSTEFEYTDKSFADEEEKIYYPGDFLTEDAGIVYDFSPNNTSIVTENGIIIKMYKAYTP